MNERIRELLVSMGIDLHYTPDHGYVLENFTFEPDSEKFAQLIIQDCLAVIEKRMDLGTDERCREECKALISEIKQHFGVEE